MGWGGTEGGGKMSNAMSHSALAVREGDKGGGQGVKGENTFACCMKLDAICHSSWAACSVRALGLTGLVLPLPTPKATPFSPN